MSDDHAGLGRAYKRGAIGLGLAAAAWLVAFLVGGVNPEERINWLIPVAAATISVLCFSLYLKSKTR